MLKLGSTEINKIYLGEAEINKIYLGEDEVFGGGVVPPVPLVAPHPNLVDLLGITVFQSGEGDDATFTTSYDWQAERAALAPVNTFWVDKDTGNNNNDGSQASPFRSIDLAVKMVQDTGVLGCVRVKGAQPNVARPRYLSTATQARSGQATNNATWPDAMVSTFTDVEVIIEPWNAGELFDSWRSVANVTWTATGDANIWRNSSQVSNVFDYSNLDRKYAPRKLFEINLTAGTSEADAIIAVNSAYEQYSGLSDLGGPEYATGVCCRVASGFTLIRTFDNRTPNTDANLQFEAATAGPQIRVSTKASRLFAVGMGFGGGTTGTGALYILGTSAYRPVVNFAYCRFMGGRGAGCLTVAGTTTAGGADVISYESTAIGGELDGWNYHDACNVYEINCGGDYNGWTTGLTNNGTSVHETTLCVRVNGSYLHNQDRSVHDVGAAKCWLLAPVSGTRRGEDGTPQSCPYAAGIEGVSGTATLWMQKPRISNGVDGPPEYTTQANNTNNAVYVADADFTPVVGPSATPGTVGTYTP